MNEMKGLSKLPLEKFAEAAMGGLEDRLRFYATAYNVGYLSGKAALRQMMNKRRFHVALILPTVTCNDADVALFFFPAH
jgi:hypothetical protein